MNCLDVNHCLSAWMEGDLSLLRALELENHLKHCPLCAATVASLRITVRLARRAMLTGNGMAPERERELIERIRRTVRERIP